MTKKLREYFGAGVQVAWIVDIRKRTVGIYTAVDQSDADQGGQADRLRHGIPGILAPTGRVVRQPMSHDCLALIAGLSPQLDVWRPLLDNT